MSIKEQIEAKLKHALESSFDYSGPLIIEVPSLTAHGDYSSNVAMLLAPKLKMSPLKIAEDIVLKLGQDPLWDSVEVANPGFINFRLNKSVLVKQTIRAALENTLLNESPKFEKVLVEHTSVNPNKAMHIGHIRNSILGDTIARLFRRLNYNVEVHNYIDDTGVQVADTVNAVLNLGATQPEGQHFDDYCWDLYTQINKLYVTEPKHQENRKHLLEKIEERNNDIARQANDVVEKIVDRHLTVLADFGILFDLLVYESAIIEFGFWEAAFDKLQKSENFVYETSGENAGCWVLKYDDANIGDKVFVRSNGTKVYTAKDTAYHLWKFGLLNKDFLYKKWTHEFLDHPVYKTSLEGEENTNDFGNGNIIINIIDERQTYPQDMVKHALNSLGYHEEYKNYHHLAYGVVSLSRKTAEALGIDTAEDKEVYAMSGRKGIGVKVTDLLNLVENEVVKVQSTSDDSEAISAKEIAVAAIKHYMLKYNPQSAVTFDYTQAIQLTGNTGPYLQYSHARASNILRKVNKYVITYEKDGLLTETEFDLAKRIAQWPEVAKAAASSLNVSALSEYAFSLSKDFHAFYENNSVLSAPDNIKDFRLSLTEAFANTIRDVLSVLGISAPERM